MFWNSKRCGLYFPPLSERRTPCVVGEYKSEAIEVKGGKTYAGSTWITQPRVLNEKLVAPLKPAEFVIFRIGQKTIIKPGRPTIPLDCKDATHAVQITLVSNHERFSGDSGTGKTMGLCVNVGQ